MKAALYAVVREHGPLWQYTIHPGTDRQYWFQLHGRQADAVWLEPIFSFGQAVWLVERLNGRGINPYEPSAVQEAVVEGLKAIGMGIGGSGDGSGAQGREGREGRGSEGRMRGNRTFAALVRISRFPPNCDWGERVEGSESAWLRNSLPAALEGRQLLVEELEAMLAGVEVDRQMQGDRSSTEVTPSWRPLLQRLLLEGKVELTTGIRIMEEKKRWSSRLIWQCRRCGSGETQHRRSPCPHCGGPCPYCEQCLTMGRTRFCSLLIRRPRQLSFQSTGHRSLAIPDLDKWGLSPAQREAVAEALRYVDSSNVNSNNVHEGSKDREGVNSGNGDRMVAGGRNGNSVVTQGLLSTTRGAGDDSSPASLGSNSRPTSFDNSSQPAGKRRFLLWAVTGAGKTEMLFPLIDQAIARGGRVLIATPRRDVVLELLPRVEKAFPNEQVIGLYGGSPHRWERGTITVATTHQLLRFYQAFDLVVIDELDAFPYHNNPMLTFAAEQVGTVEAPTILLSATPPQRLQREVASGQLAHARVPVRYHRHPLPVPRWIRTSAVQDWLKRRRLPLPVKRLLQRSIDRDAQLFVFVARIEQVEKLVALLRQEWPQLPIGGTASTDEERADKVVQFRGRSFRILVTTTILERGVTIPKSDVFILDADSGLFDEAALVQMAGRAGRSANDPAGHVFFASPAYTRSQQGAIRQIRRMNRIAGQKGYLLEQEGNRVQSIWRWPWR